MVGDCIPKDCKSANLANVPTIWVNIKPCRHEKNVEAINTRTSHYDIAIHSLTQLPSALKMLRRTARFNVGVILPTMTLREQLGRVHAFESDSDIRYHSVEHLADIQT